MRDLAWYNETVKYQVPQFIDEIKKTITEEKGPLITYRSGLIDRLTKAEAFFSQSPSANDIARGITTLKDILNELHTVDNKIQSLDTKIAMILEAKLSDVSFKLRIPGKINSMMEDVLPKEIVFVPWNTIQGESRIEVTPEDIWFFRMVRNTFSVTEKNIEFLDIDKSKELYEIE